MKTWGDCIPTDWGHTGQRCGEPVPFFCCLLPLQFPMTNWEVFCVHALFILQCRWNAALNSYPWHHLASLPYSGWWNILLIRNLGSRTMPFIVTKVSNFIPFTYLISKEYDATWHFDHSVLPSSYSDLSQKIKFNTNVTILRVWYLQDAV